MRNSNSKQIAFLGVFAALMFVFLWIETHVVVPFFPFPPAVLTLPLAIALSLSMGKKSMLVGGTMFGICSFVLSFIIGLGVFMNPLVSIFPRIFIGLIAFLVYEFAKKIFSKNESAFLNKVLPLAFAAIFGIVTNTVLTITMMWLFNSAAIATVFSTLISINCIAELIGAVILVPIYVGIFKRFNKTNQHDIILDETDEEFID